MRHALGNGRTAPVEARLRILATSDLHLHLLPHDYYADRPMPATGLAQAARLIRALRAAAPGGPGACLLLDNGDFLQGNLLSDSLADRGLEALSDPPGGVPLHPMIAAMNAVGYDAATLGNHEFNHGLPFLLRSLGGAAFPIVSANLLDGAGRTLVAPSALLVREVPGPEGPLTLRIGVVGFAPPQTADWDRAALAGALRTRDILEAARDEVPRLRARGADLVVALCHSGLGPEADEPGLENAAVPLAALPGIDVVIAGHTHRTFPGEDWARTAAVDPSAGTLHGKPAVQPGFFGRHVGVVDLALARDTRDGGAWRVEGHAVRVERVARRASPSGPFAHPPMDDRVAAIARPYHDRLLAEAGRPVGQSAVAIHSYFALVAPDPSLDVVADALRAQGRRCLAGRPESHLPLLVALAPFKVGGRAGPQNYIDIPAGPVALRQAAGLYIHPNALGIVEITGAGLLDWLERSASLFCTLAPGETDQPLLDPAFPCYNFDVIDGLSWTVDPTRPPRTDGEGRVLDPRAARVGDLRHDGRPVAPGDRFALVTNSYRLGGGGGFEAARAARPLLEDPRPIREAILAHLRAGPLAPAPRARWRFAARPGTAAWFDSGPGALACGALAPYALAPYALAPDVSVADRDIAPLGPAPEGFHRFRLRF